MYIRCLGLLIRQRWLNGAASFELLGLISLALILFLHFSFSFFDLELLDDSLCIFNLEAFLHDLLVYLAQVLSSFLLFLHFLLQLSVLFLYFLRFFLLIRILLIQILHLLLQRRLLDLVLHVQLFGVPLVLLQGLAELILQLEQLGLEGQQLVCVRSADLLLDRRRHLAHLVRLVR